MTIYTLLAYEELPTVVKYCLEANRGVGITYLSEKEMYGKLPFLEKCGFTIQQKSDLLRYYLLAEEPCWWIDATVEVKNSDVFSDETFELAERHDRDSIKGVGINNFWDLENRVTLDNFIEQSLAEKKRAIYGELFRRLEIALTSSPEREYLYAFSVKNGVYRDYNYCPKLSFVSADTAEAMGIRGDNTYLVKHTAKIPDFMSGEEKQYLLKIKEEMKQWLKK